MKNQFIFFCWKYSNWSHFTTPSNQKMVVLRMRTLYKMHRFFKWNKIITRIKCGRQAEWRKTLLLVGNSPYWPHHLTENICSSCLERISWRTVWNIKKYTIFRKRNKHQIWYIHDNSGRKSIRKDCVDMMLMIRWKHTPRIKIAQ